MKTVHIETVTKILSYKDEENVEHHFDIGDTNGVLIVTKETTHPTFSSTEEEIVKAFGPFAWISVWRSGDD